MCLEWSMHVGFCKYLRAQAFRYPARPPLPVEILNSFRPFECTGVDYSGPHYIIRETVKKKVWVALFTCLVSRAIHCEVVPDLTGVTFVNALQNMAALYTVPKIIISDQGTNLVGANEILSKIYSTTEVRN